MISVPGAPAGNGVVGVLIAIDGELRDSVYKLYGDENTIGRETTCRVVLASEWISREHAVIIHQDGFFAISPLKEDRPLVINGETIGERSQLSDGDTISLGKTTLKFRTV